MPSDPSGTPVLPQSHAGSRVILGLGMHRGGLATLAQLLARLQIGAPDLAAVDDDILASSGSGWNDWRPFRAEWIDPARTRLVARMQAVLQFSPAQAPLLLSDPRLARLLPVWEPAIAALGCESCALILLRHPASVVQSLQRWAGMAANTASLLWLRHMLAAERDTRHLPRALLSYEALLQDAPAALAGVGRRLGISWPRDPVAALAGHSLGARPAEAEAGPQTGSAYADVWCRHAWQALRGLEQGDPAAQGVLDRVGAQFDDACRLFSPGDVAPPAVARSRQGRPALRGVTLCAADTSRVGLTLRALSRSAAGCDFADVVLFSDQAPDGPARLQRIEKLASRQAYSDFMLRGLVEHITTDFALVVQWDGFVVEPDAWEPAFLHFDYIGARWPWHAEGENVGNGGFSLRSRRLLEALRDPRFVPLPGVPEDELIGRVWRPELEQAFGIRYAPGPVADRFSYERGAPSRPSFGFHGMFNLWRHLDDARLAGMVRLMPAEVVHQREYAELTALCFLHERPASLRALTGAWLAEASGERIAAAMRAVLRDADLATCLRMMGI